MSKNIIEKFDENNNKIYYKHIYGECWREYDKNSNLIHYKNSSGTEQWWKFDENNNKIYYENNYGVEIWYKYDKNYNLIHEKDNKGDECWYKHDRIIITEKEYKEVEFRKKEKEYNSRTKCSRFEIMDI